MEDSDKKKLIKNHVFLIKNLLLTDEFFAYMYCEDIMTDSLLQPIKAINEAKRDSRIAEFLSILYRRGPRAFPVFMESLMLTQQDFVAKQLDPDFVSKWNQSQNTVKPTSNSEIVLSPVSQPLEENIEENYKDAIIPINIKEVDEEFLKKYLNDTTRVYKMRRKPRGRAIIINIIDFDGTNLMPREGAQYDGINMQALFRELRFEVVLHVNLTKSDIIKVLKQEKEREEHKTADAFVLCIMSHGAAGVIYGKDNGKVDIDHDIIKQFDGKNCPYLAGKPKIFILQACQGDDATEGVAVIRADSHPEAHGQPDNDLAVDLARLRIGDTPDTVPVLNIHEMSDMVLAYASVTGFKAYRHALLGSWFIRSFIKHVCEYSCTEHFTDLLTQVINEVSKMRTNDDKLMYGFEHEKQVPQLRSTLTKKVFLFPGYYEL